MLVFLACLFFLGFTVNVTAQTGTIKGIVVDAQTNERLIGASLVLVGSNKGAVTDMDGSFLLSNVATGTYDLRVSYISYVTEEKKALVVENAKTTVVDIALKTTENMFGDVVVVGRANRQSETVLLKEQKMALLSTQAVGSREMTRKGLGDAEAAVAHLAGITKQEGVKNVFVRGLGDRYNATTLNGFPLPSEDPEYKNIALSLFSSDMIQAIGVNKVFEGRHTGDVGGALINISSRNLVGDGALGFELATGMNNKAWQEPFLRQSGSNFLGFSQPHQPSGNHFDFTNALNPSSVQSPLNQSFVLSGGKKVEVGERRRPLTFFVIASYDTDYAYTKESIRNATNNGTIYQNQTGEKFSQTISQILLANADLNLGAHRHFAYNLLLLHANDQYVAHYSGMNCETYQDAAEFGYNGFLMRQQTNENLLITQQLISEWSLSDRSTLNAGISYNTITGLEPDRRESNLSSQGGTYIFTGSNRQKRFYSELSEHDVTLKMSYTYKLTDAFDSGHSTVMVGYDGRYVNDQFSAVEYNLSAFPGYYSLDNLDYDALYNQANYSSGLFSMAIGDPNEYAVTKFLNAVYAEGNYQLTSKLSGNLGFRFDYVDMAINHRIQSASPGVQSIIKPYFLPSVNLKYEVSEKHALRFGASKTYTLPQSKEVSPYQYVNIGFVSQGNTRLKPSDNYNVDIKWDYYISPVELFSLNGFYKYIIHPIGRVDEGNSAGLLTYKNSSHSAMVAGLELESRKNIVNHVNKYTSANDRLSVGLNASSIFTDLVLDIVNTKPRHTGLEGASPYSANLDLSYNRIVNGKNLLLSVVSNYYSDRIFTLGTMGYKDIIDKGVCTIDVVSSFKWNDHFTVKLKASNVLDPTFQLVRESANGHKIILNEYKKGMNVSLGIAYSL